VATKPRITLVRWKIREKRRIKSLIVQCQGLPPGAKVKVQIFMNHLDQVVMNAHFINCQRVGEGIVDQDGAVRIVCRADCFNGFWRANMFTALRVMNIETGEIYAFKPVLLPQPWALIWRLAYFNGFQGIINKPHYVDRAYIEQPHNQPGQLFT
jgi:hypothetical protein